MPTGGATGLYFASLLRAGTVKAKPENDFCYGLLPKGEPERTTRLMYVMDKMYQGKIRGGFCLRRQPHEQLPQHQQDAQGSGQSGLMVCAELHNSETTDNWHRPGVDPKKMKTEVFLLPSAHRVKKGRYHQQQSGRWLLVVRQGRGTRR